MARIYAYIVMLVLFGATAYPLANTPHGDGFPLSTYPMFSDKRPTTMRVGSVLAVLDDGSREIVAPQLIANSEVLQANATIQRAIHGGERSATALCKRVIKRLPSYAPRTLISVEIVTGTYDAVKYFEGHTEPTHTVTHARCWPEAPGAKR